MKFRCKSGITMLEKKNIRLNLRFIRLNIWLRKIQHIVTLPEVFIRFMFI